MTAKSVEACKFGENFEMIKLGFKSRSRRVVQDSSVAVEKSKSCSAKREDDVDADGRGNSCWDNLPWELLREVLFKLEESESEWPLRKHVVACAGVCRSWREVMKEVVKAPEVSGKITFPISLKQPGPRESLIQCYIKRNRSTQTYHLFLSLSQALADDGKFLLAARKHRRTTCTDYMISLHTDEMCKGSPAYLGKLRSNFLGTKFVVYEAFPSGGEAKMSRSWSTHMGGSKHFWPKFHAVGYPVAHISFELNVLGARGPRRMQCILDTFPASAIKPGDMAPTSASLPNTTAESSSTIPFRTKSNDMTRSLSGPLNQGNSSFILRNKAPRWHEQLQCWCLNFNGRVTVASVKNFQLVASPETLVSGPAHDKVILQFGKVGKDVFTMDYQYPVSAFQAFAICLSSFDTRIACE